jgi:hypothetical protein
MVSANINSGRIIHEPQSSEATSHLELSADYSNGASIQIVNYIQPNELLHHQKLIKLDANYLQPKDQMHLHEGTNIQSQPQTSLPMLTPLKYWPRSRTKVIARVASTSYTRRHRSFPTRSESRRSSTRVSLTTTCIKSNLRSSCQPKTLT